MGRTNFAGIVGDIVIGTGGEGSRGHVNAANTAMLPWGDRLFATGVALQAPTTASGGGEFSKAITLATIAS